MSIVGIDVGGTKCHAVLVDDDGVVAAEARRATPPADDLVGVLMSLVAELGGATTLGVGVPGLVTPEGVVRASPNLVGARDTSVGPALREALGIAVHVENDATAAAYGEWRAGAARGVRDAVMVTLGTGIGGGLVMGGRLQRGARGFAGEIGHMIVERDGVPCPCGHRGCWERYASGSALAALGGAASGQEVVKAARAGDAAALATMEEFAGWVALGLSNLTNICDPEVIVLGGGVIEAAELLMPLVRPRFGDALYSPQWRAHPRLEAAMLGPRAGAIGVALLAASDEVG